MSYNPDPGEDAVDAAHGPWLCLVVPGCLTTALGMILDHLEALTFPSSDQSCFGSCLALSEFLSIQSSPFSVPSSLLFSSASLSSTSLRPPDPPLQPHTLIFPFDDKASPSNSASRFLLCVPISLWFSGRPVRSFSDDTRPHDTFRFFSNQKSHIKHIPSTCSSQELFSPPSPASLRSRVCGGPQNVVSG